MTVEIGAPTTRDFGTWYAAAAAEVGRGVGAVVGDPLVAREATAEAFARAYERWERVSEMDSPEGWVHRVAVNLCRRGWQQRTLESRALARLLPAVIPGVDEHRDDVYRAVRALPHRMRTAVRLRYWDDLSEREIAERMGVATGTVSALLSGARTRLRRHLDGDATAAGGAT